MNARTDIARSARNMEKRPALLVHPKMADILGSVVRMFVGGLQEVGLVPDLLETLSPDFSGRAIVLGANFFAAGELDRLEDGSIIFNVENMSSPFISDSYRELLRKFVVWDFSEANAISLSKQIARPVYYVRMFYVESLSRINSCLEMDIDVLFYGSFNARRQKILGELRARGLRIEAVFGVYGTLLDQLIARSKVVVNIHFYDNGHLEMIRIFDLLANGRAVVTEANAGEHVDADLAGAFVAVPYEGLVDATEALVKDVERRHNVAIAGFRAFSNRRPNTVLPEALAWSETPRPPSNAVIGSGKMYDLKSLNIDISERWRPDIVADIADAGLFNREFVSDRFGVIQLQRGWFDSITASHVLEHVPDLVTAMTNCLELLTDGGLLKIMVPYDLSYGAWQDPTHLHAFNERSWLYYCEWYWYLGWTDSRFDLLTLIFRNSFLGEALAARGMPQDEILRSPRAVDEMHVVLRKRALTPAERDYGRGMRGDARACPPSDGPASPSTRPFTRWVRERLPHDAARGDVRA
jgi:SAM-dependent methyltransferase